ncbi:Mpped1 [Symbiodinium sp. CCMP2592]|nr:Mpped1 [Symbiodinium sp. CCMP2592]
MGDAPGGVCATELPLRLMPVADAALRPMPGREALRVADVGCYKALLALHLVQRDASVWVLATDLASGPLEVGRMLARALPTDQCRRIDFRQGDGLSALDPGEVDVVCAAGIAAGKLSTWIPCAAQFAQRLVLQPSVPTSPEAMMELRCRMADFGWALQDELLSIEKGGICLTLVAEVATSSFLREAMPLLPTAPRSRIRHTLQTGTEDDPEVEAFVELLQEYLERTGPGTLRKVLQEELDSLNALRHEHDMDDHWGEFVKKSLDFESQDVGQSWQTPGRGFAGSPCRWREAAAGPLHDESIELDSLKIHGSPLSAGSSPNGAFQSQSGYDEAKAVSAVPEGLDILVTHGPAGEGALGRASERLQVRIDEVRPRVHIFGHYHLGHGVACKDGVVQVNASRAQARASRCLV